MPPDATSLARHLVTAALGLLAVVMAWRADLARRTPATDPRRFIGHVGFTTVGLIDAFVVDTIFNRGALGRFTRCVGRCGSSRFADTGAGLRLDAAGR